MKIVIKFPDGRTVKLGIKITPDITIEDLAYQIAISLCEDNPRIVNVDKCTESHARWLIPRLYSELLETVFR